MFIDRPLRLAIIISFFWHLFWMSSVSIMFLPLGFKPRSFVQVNFLGTIVSNEPAKLSKTAENAINLNQIINLAAWPKEDSNETQLPDLPLERKGVEPDELIDVDVPAQIKPFAAGSSADESSPERVVIFQPPLPQYPEWTQQEFKKGTIVFDVYISASGLVEQLVNLEGSGNPDIDAALARYIRRWRFAPAEERDACWQNVKIDLD